MKHLIFTFTLFALLANHNLSFADMTITYRAPDSVADKRFDYEIELLTRVLEVTTKEFGSYTMSPGRGMNFPRALDTAKHNKMPNFFFKTSYSNKYNEDYVYAPIPVDLGIVGYRVCFTSEKNLEKFERIESLAELKKLSIGQGQGWNDVSILRHNNFTVKEIPKYHNLFPMVASKRFDLFCRGANEVKYEWEQKKHIKGLAVEGSFVLFYPLPRFFWTNKTNTQALERVSLGLKKSYEDGSLLTIWKKHHQESIDFIHLKDRKVFKLENPQLKNVVQGYEKYFFNPFKK